MGLATLLRLAANFGVALIIARVLGAETKGHVALLQQLPMIAALILSFGFEGANAYFVGRGRNRPDYAISDSIYLALIVSVIGVPVIALVMFLLVPALAGIPLTTIAVAASAVPLLIFSSLVSGVLTGQGKVSLQALSTTIASILFFGLTVALLSLGMLNLLSLIVAILASVIMGALLNLIATGVKGVYAPSFRRLREQFSYAGRNHIQTVSGYLETRQDFILLGLLGSAAGVGIYSVGVSIAELLFYAPSAIATALTARSLKEEAQSGAELTARITRLLLVISLIAAAMLIALAGPLVTVLFGEQFSGAIGVITILVPALALWGVASQSATYLGTHGVLFPRLSVFTLLLNLGLNIILIPTLGILGAAIATSLSYTISSVYVMRAFIKSAGLRPSDLIIPRRDDFRFALAALRAFFSRGQAT